MHSKVNVSESPEFNISVFYLPCQDKRCPPEKGIYGGDSFSIERLEDGRLFIIFRNGVSHGYIGRDAIKKGDKILEEIISNKVKEKEINELLRNRDVFEELDLFACSLNELLIRRHPETNLRTSTLILGANKSNAFNYVSCGDSYLFIIKSGKIYNEGNIVERKLPIGGMSIENIKKFFKQTYKEYYSIRSTSLDAGDKVIICSDGLTSGITSQRTGDFGFDRLKEIISNYGYSAPRPLIETVNKIMQKYKGKSCIRDDYTILVLEKK